MCMWCTYQSVHNTIDDNYTCRAHAYDFMTVGVQVKYQNGWSGLTRGATIAESGYTSGASLAAMM